MGARLAWTVSMISALSDALEVDGSDAEVAVAERSLDDDKGHSFMRHLDGVGVPQLMRRKPPTHSSGPRARRSSIHG
jgi:hypothetical protein